MRHSLSVGELATYWNATRGLGVDLRVISARDWTRSRDLPDLSLPLPASPNMPDIEAAQVYPGTCFFEGTNVSEGRGTATPFRGAGRAVAGCLRRGRRALNAHNLPGRGSAFEFIPAAGKYAGEMCQGVMLHVTNRKTLRPVAYGLTLLTTIAALQPDDFALAALSHCCALPATAILMRSSAAPTSARPSTRAESTRASSGAGRLAPSGATQ
ncbi:MAG: DUF1343 domain-containing protein [Caldilineaceae bacterium]